MILEQETFEKFGYCPKNLGKGSNKICIYACDYCKRVTEKEFYRILRGRKKIIIDVCEIQECKNKKLKEIYQKSTSKRIDEINQKKVKTSMERYGADNAFKLKEKQAKAENTRLKKYGVKHVLQNKEVQQKRKNTLMERYGTHSSLDASGRKEQIIEILKSKAESTTKKGIETSIKKYGCTNVGLLEETKEKRRKTFVKKYGVDNNSILQRISFKTILKFCENKGYQALFSEDDYEHRRQLLRYKCLKHEEVFETRVENLMRDVNNCPSCKFITVSKQEDEIYSFCLNLGISNQDILRSDRSRINPYELDIFIPSHNIAIEHHGLYWHSSANKVDASYHKRKFQKCKEKGVKLFQFFEDEWRDKQKICKSMISNGLGKTSNKLNARDLSVKQDLSLKRCNDFLEESHLMGSYNGVHAKTFCLLDKDENIVCCLLASTLFEKSADKNKKNYLEIVRFGTKIDTNVRGGFSRLLNACKSWARQNSFYKIVTFSDCRYSEGDVYQKEGFVFISSSFPNYYYTNFIERYAKYKFRSKDGRSEKDIVSEIGLFKIYNSGTYRWELNLAATSQKA